MGYHESLVAAQKEIAELRAELKVLGEEKAELLRRLHEKQAEVEKANRQPVVVEIEEVPTYNLKINGEWHSGFTAESSWGNFVKMRNPEGLVAVLHTSAKQSIFDGIFKDVLKEEKEPQNSTGILLEGSPEFVPAPPK